MAIPAAAVSVLGGLSEASKIAGEVGQVAGFVPKIIGGLKKAGGSIKNVAKKAGGAIKGGYNYLKDKRTAWRKVRDEGKKKPGKFDRRKEKQAFKKKWKGEHGGFGKNIKQGWDSSGTSATQSLKDLESQAMKVMTPEQKKRYEDTKKKIVDPAKEIIDTTKEIIDTTKAIHDAVIPSKKQPT